MSTHNISAAGVNQFKALLYLREYLDYDKYLKGGFNSDPSPLPANSKSRIDGSTEDWVNAVKDVLSAISDADKTAFIQLFQIKDASGNLIAPADLKAKTISDSILTKKSSSDDLYDAFCKLGIDGFCPAPPPVATPPVITALKVTVSTITPPTAEPGQTITIVITGENLDLVKSIKSELLASLEIDPAKSGKKKITLKAAVVPEDAQFRAYKFSLLNDNQDEVGSVSINVASAWLRANDAYYNKLHGELSVSGGAGGYMGANENDVYVGNKPALETVPNFSAHLAFEPKITGSNDGTRSLSTLTS